MPLQIASFFQHGEERALGELARGRRVVELGSYKGGSTIMMAKAGAEVVHSVDWHGGDNHLGYQNTLCTMWHNVVAADVRRQVVLHVGRFQDVLPLFRPRSFDLAFVDGCHEHETAARDIRLVLPLLVSDGVLACHDYGRWGVQSALQSVIGELGLGRDIELIHSLAIVRLSRQGEAVV